jgi:hypothetical protein
MCRPHLWVALSVAVVAGVALPRSASAETLLRFLEGACPNGSQILALQKRTDEADALEDGRRHADHRELARLYYRCSQAQGSPYMRDVATLFYALNLDASARTNGEAFDRGTMAADVCNDLAAATRFEDVRRMAIRNRNQFRRDAQAAYETIYGSPEPSSPETESSHPLVGSSPNPLATP